MKLRFLDIYRKTKFEKAIFQPFLRNLADGQSDEWMDGQMARPILWNYKIICYAVFTLYDINRKKRESRTCIKKEREKEERRYRERTKKDEKRRKKEMKEKKEIKKQKKNEEKN